MPAKRRATRIAVSFISLSLLLTARLIQAQEPPPSPKPGIPLGPEVWVGAPIVSDSPCEILARRVCGERGACAQQPACAEVQALLEQERQQRAASDNPRRMTYASGQCQEADRDRTTYVSCGL